MRLVLSALILLLADFSDSEGWQKNLNINKNEHYSKTRFLVAKHNYHNTLPKPIPRITEWDDASPTTTTPAPISTPSPSSRENALKRKRFLKKERGKLRKSLRTVKVRENKKVRDGILRRIYQINAELGKSGRKNAKRRQRKRKHKTQNILEVTTARSKTLLHKLNLSDNASLNKMIKKLNQNPEVDHKSKGKDFNLLPQTIVKDTTEAYENKTGAQSVPNAISRINYADLMRVHTTTMPPMKNVSLDTILEEFNVISNQIGILFPGRQKYPNRTKDVVETYRRTKTRCSNNKGGCEHVCHPRGPRRCSCLKGFKLSVNKRQCLDINECLNNNGGCTNTCHNTPGSYYCTCSMGLRLSGDGKSCEDINECLLRNGHGPCQDTCVNTYRSYECSCNGLNGTRLGRDKHSCEDVDECLEGRSGCSHGCVNTLGRAYCTCPDGFELGSDWKICQDINECDDNEINKCNFGCINTMGSYFCTDDFDVQSDQSITPVPDHVACPPLFPPRLGFLECSREKGLRVKMRSKSGRTRVTNRPGTFCQLICPAGYSREGSFQVICGLDGQWMGDKTGTCLGSNPS